MRIAKSLAVLAVVSLLTVACSSSSNSGSSSRPQGSPVAGGTLNVARSESFDGWNPDAAAAYATYQTLAAVLEPMVRDASNGKDLEAGIAEKWTYDAAAKTWTFNLRPGVKFSDGTPLTSADVVFSEKIWAAGANYGLLYSNIVKTAAPDASTVVFTLKRPDSSLPNVMSWTSSAVFPKNFGGRTQKAYFAKPIGAGAFTVDTWTPGGKIVLKRSPNYYIAGHPYLDGVNVDVVADANTRATMFQSGQIDISEFVSSVDAAQYGTSLIALPTSQVEHLSLNTKRPIFADENVRKAITQAINYGAIVKGPYHGYGSDPQGIVAPNLSNWAAPTVPSYSYNVAGAKALLASSKNPTPRTLEIVFDAGVPTDSLVAQVIQQNLAEVGIKTKLSGLETGAFLGRAYGQDADMVLWNYGAVSPDVSDPIGWFLGTSWLFTGAPTAALNAKYVAYGAATDAAAKQAIVTTIQNDALIKADAIPVANFKVLQGVAQKVGGFASAPWGLYYWDPIWLAK